MSNSLPPLEVISFDTCPYVERIRIVLHEKGLPFAQRFVDLGNKPDWFLKLSPRGKVPVLLVKERALFESTVINEYLEEAFPAPALMPQDPLLRAEARAWIAFNGDVLMPAAARLWFLDTTPEGQQTARTELRGALERVETHLAGRTGGPWFQGEHFGLVDAVFAPLWTRWPATEAMGHGDLLEGLENLKAYQLACLGRASVQEAQAPELNEKLLETRREWQARQATRS